MFSKAYAEHVLRDGEDTFDEWIEYARAHCILLILDVNTLVNGSVKKTMKKIKALGFVLKLIVFRKDIFIFQHPINKSTIALHFPLSAFMCLMPSAGKGDRRLQVSLMRSMTIEFLAAIVRFLAGEEPLPETGCLALEAGTMYEFRRGLLAHKLYAGFAIKVVLAPGDNLYSKCRLKTTPKSGLFGHARQSQRQHLERDSSNSQIDNSIVHRAENILSFSGYDSKCYRKIPDEQLIAQVVELFKGVSSSQYRRRWYGLIKAIKDSAFKKFVEESCPIERVDSGTWMIRYQELTEFKNKY